MKNQDAFVAARSQDWAELDRILGDRGAIHTLDGPTISRMAALYRCVCDDLMRSRAAGYSSDLHAYLDGLAGRAHNVFYAAQPFRMPSIVNMIAHDFPVTLRRNGRFFLLACLLFFLPFLVGMVGSLLSSDFAQNVLPAAMLEAMKHSYAEGFHSGRGEGADAAMAGFYVYNNIGIAFRCFATGILFGLGSLFFLIYNGLVTGTVVGYVSAAGHGSNILTFVCGHSPFELTAIVVAGSAGLRMGYSLVETKGRTRLGSLRACAPDLARMILGAALMLLIAAFIEGFWSPSSLAAPIKWTASGVFVVLVAGYLGLAGRNRARAESAGPLAIRQTGGTK